MSFLVTDGRSKVNTGAAAALAMSSDFNIVEVYPKSENRKSLFGWLLYSRKIKYFSRHRINCQVCMCGGVFEGVFFFESFFNWSDTKLYENTTRAVKL